MDNDKSQLDVMFAFKRMLEGMFRGDYPPTVESAAYNRAIGEMMEQVMRMINDHFDARIRRTCGYCGKTENNHKCHLPSIEEMVGLLKQPN